MEPGTTIGLETFVRAAPDPLAAAVGDEIALLSLPRGRYYGLNPSGARVWEFIQQPIRVGDLLTRMLELYEINEAECRADLLGLLTEMDAAGLIEVIHGAGAGEPS